MARDDLLERCPQLKTTDPDLTLARLIADEEAAPDRDPAEDSVGEREARSCSVAGGARPAMDGARFAIDAERIMRERSSQIPRVFAEAGQQARIARALAPRHSRALGRRVKRSSGFAKNATGNGVN